MSALNRPFALAAALLLALGVHAEVHLPEGFAREVIAGPELKEPMDLAFAPDGAAWVTGRSGEVWRIDTVTRAHHLVGKIPTDTAGDRGLHGIAFHPAFPKVPHLFLFHHAVDHPKGTYLSRVGRWTVEGLGAGSRLAAGPDQVLLELAGDEGGQHVGGGLLAHPGESALYVTTGDNNKIWELKDYCRDPKNRAQSTADLRGKVLRVGFDGKAPSDNPFVKETGARPEVYTVGHRQPWSLSLDAATGWVLLAENGGDEQDDHEKVNRLVPGANHGWPRIFADGMDTLTRTNHVDGFATPWFSYKRANGGSCTGALLYRAKPGTAGAFPERFHGGMFYSDYNRKTVRFAPIDAKTRRPANSEPFAQGLPGGPVSLRLGPDGALYLVEYGGWFAATTNDCISRVVFRR